MGATVVQGRPALKAPPLPREHGSWFMLLVPCAAGLVAAGAVNLPGLIFVLVATAFFLARQPLILLARRTADANALGWLAVWSAVAGLGMAALLVSYGRLVLLPLAGIGLALLLYELWRLRHSPRPDLKTEVLAAIGLASGAPGAYVAARGLFDQTAAVIWLLSALYFLAAVFYVNLMLAWVKRNPSAVADRWNLGRSTLVVHLIAVAVPVGMALEGLAPALVPLAFLPSLGKAARQVFQGQRETSFKRLGLMEAGHSLLFLTLLIFFFR